MKAFDKYWRNGKDAPDYDLLTIEHIAPEKRTQAWNVSKEYVGMIGNLILVTEELNERLANKKYSKKISAIVLRRFSQDGYFFYYWG